MAVAAIPVAYYVAALAALAAAVLWYTYVVQNPEKVAELGRQIDALLEEIANLFKGQPLPGELEEAKRKAEEALEKAKQRDKKPSPDPYPPPLLPPNRGPDPYERDRKREECEKKKQQYRWGPHSEVQKNLNVVNGIPEQSHHVLQDAHFTSGRGYGLASVCGAYHTDDAPALPVIGGTAYENSPHDLITKAQRQISTGYARRFNGPPPGPRPTFSEANADGMGLVATHTTLAADPVALACLQEYVNDYFSRNCSGMTGTSPLRIPWLRPADPGP